MLNAQFLGVVQILVYAGAIVVLFLFVVMLLGEQLGEEISTWLTGQNAVMALLAVVLLTFLGTSVFEYPVTTGAKGDFTAEAIQEFGQSQMIGVVLFTDYFLSVQLAGILLLVGIVGVIWLAQNERGIYVFNETAPPRHTSDDE
jgi:NADH-quinone oxidoreductase subunit J